MAPSDLDGLGRRFVAPASSTIEPIAIAVPLDEPNLAYLLESYLLSLQRSGALQRAPGFWLKDRSWVRDLH